MIVMEVIADLLCSEWKWNKLINVNKEKNHNDYDNFKDY